ncbi:MAG TPA: methylmalonyl Co-A mutase-associated GTPase MeaB [Saprospiraceae bacterium]|nr:methylmalonyl Co-A mutase-associated GTPase MeaB [Saprospiraceae bacterium]
MNPQFLKSKSFHKKELPSLTQFKNGILSGDRIILAQAITLIESTKKSHHLLAQELVEACLPFANQSIRLGITGSPGVGKSTFIEALGEYLISKNHRLAVLAIDPSSSLTKGSILGDKTRMMKLSANSSAFIRPSAAGKSLGGVARKTRETIVLCEAAGYDTIIIETVGVGQSETAVHSMVDFFLLLLLPGAGDELQGIKRGIVEMADMIVVNKTDGEREKLAKQTRRAYKNALHLFPAKESNWPTKVNTCSAINSKGIDKIWEQIKSYKSFCEKNKYFEKRRRQQAAYWLSEALDERLRALLFQNKKIKKLYLQLEQDVLAAKLSPFKAVEELMKKMLNT